jgi:hypothetical protein
MITIDREAQLKPPSKVRRRLLNANTNFAKSLPQVDREAGIIRDYSVITEGEALGHDMWIDSDFLQSVVELGNAAQRGVKVRYTHPGACSDGLGKALGRATNFRVKGKQVIADLKFLESAYNTPDGNLAGYVMDLAEEDPRLFGTSIVFDRDIEEEEGFSAANSHPNGEFMSPDRRNKRNLTHARISNLYASDVVDEPAANPGGMFSSDGVPAFGAQLLDYIFADAPAPDAAALGVHPERIKMFALQYLSARFGAQPEESEVPLMDSEQVEVLESDKDEPAPLEVSAAPDPQVVDEMPADGGDVGLLAAKIERERCAKIVREIASLSFSDKLAQMMLTKTAQVIDSDEMPEKAIAKLCIEYSRSLTDNYRVTANPEAASVEPVGLSGEDRLSKARQLCASNPGMTITEAMKLVARGE